MVVVTMRWALPARWAAACSSLADGKLVEEGTPKDIFENPQSPRLQDFLSKVLM